MEWLLTSLVLTNERCSVALACRQLKGSHAFDVIASLLISIPTEYNTQKIVRTTTDNGFQFPHRPSGFMALSKTILTHLEREVVEVNDNEEDKALEVEVEAVEIAYLIYEDNCSEYQLPKHLYLTWSQEWMQIWSKFKWDVEKCFGMQHLQNGGYCGTRVFDPQ